MASVKLTAKIADVIYLEHFLAQLEKIWELYVIKQCFEFYCN